MIIKEYIKIIFLIIKYQIFIYHEDKLPIPLRIRFLTYFLTLIILPNKIKKPLISFKERLVITIQALGPLYVKFAQILSIRNDLLGPELTSILSNCQSQLIDDISVEDTSCNIKSDISYIKQHFDNLNISISVIVPSNNASIAEYIKPSLRTANLG